MHEAGCIWEQWQHAQCVHAGVWVHAWLPGVTHGPGACTRPEKHARCVQMSAGGTHEGSGEERRGRRKHTAGRKGHAGPAKEQGETRKAAKAQSSKAGALRSALPVRDAPYRRRRAPCPRLPPSAPSRARALRLPATYFAGSSGRGAAPNKSREPSRGRAPARCAPRAGVGGGPRAARAAEPRSPQPSARPRTRRPAPGPAQPPPQPPEPQRAGPRGLGLR